MPEKAVKLQLIRSPVGYGPRIRQTIKTLGFRKVYQVKEHKLTDPVKGMLNKVKSLIRIVEE